MVLVACQVIYRTLVGGQREVENRPPD
jgi:hypothetical protein